MTTNSPENFDGPPEEIVSKDDWMHANYDCDGHDDDDVCDDDYESYADYPNDDVGFFDE